MAKKRSTATRRAESLAASERAAAIRREQERKERRRRSLVVTLVGVAVLAIVLVVGIAVRSAQDTTGADAGTPAGAVQTYALPVGRTSAPVTVDVYEDFMCPICGEFEKASNSWLQEYAAQGKVAIRYHAISILDRASNGTDYSTRSASALGAVLDASGPEVAKKFHDLLYADQPEENSDGLSDDRLVDLAVQAGATRDQVRPAVEKRSYEQWVKNSTDATDKLDGFQGTPFVRVDGKALQGASIDQLSANLKQQVDAAQS